MTTRTISHRPIPWIIVISIGISLFLIWLIYLRTPSPTQAGWVALLPAANALFNTLCACSLTAGWIFIRRGNRVMHIRCMLTAVVLSALFLISYITYHYFHGDTLFTGQGWVRPLYFFILISHITLSVVTLPLIITTLFYAAKGQFNSHRKIARYTLPIWLYVAMTGVMVFFFLRAYS